MWKSQPGKWILWAPLTIGPTFLASLLITTTPLLQRVDESSKANLAKVGADWARIEMDGRDSRLFGDAKDDVSQAAALQAVATTPGVRLVDSHIRVVPPPPVALAPPTVGEVQVQNGMLTALGTWDQAQAKQLTVKVGDRAYTLPGAPELTSNAGTWTLKLTLALPTGTYPVTVESSDGKNPPVAAATPGAAVIAAPVVATAPAPEPTLAPTVSGASWPYNLTGTWPEGEGRKLSVTLAGKTWRLGATPGLQSDGKGAWTLAPDVALTPGSYDVKVDVTGTDGATKTTAFPAAIRIEQPTPAAAPLVAPSIAPQAPLVSLPGNIVGTWSEAADRSLQVSLGGTNYVLRKDPQLATDGQGHWTLQVPVKIADGSQKLVVQTLDASGAPIGPAVESTLDINAQPPAAPTVAAISSDKPVTEIQGTWAEGDATQLSVTIANTPLAATLGGADGALKSDGKGNWTFKLPQPLQPGNYDIVVRSTDAAGHTSSDLGMAEVKVLQSAPAQPAPQAAQPVAQPEPQAPPAQPEPQAAVQPTPAPATPKAPVEPEPQPTEETTPAQPVANGPDATLCDADLAQLQQTAPLRFSFNHDGLPMSTQPALKSYADALMSPRCAGLSFNLAGNADRWGSLVYNQQLSESRASVIARELAKLGVPSERMVVTGYSEKQPVDPQDNREAWQANRRVDIKVAK